MIWLKTVGVAIIFIGLAIAFSSLFTLGIEVVYKTIKKERMSEDASMRIFNISSLVFLVLCIPLVFQFHSMFREEDECHAAGYNMHNGKCYELIYELIEVEL